MQPPGYRPFKAAVPLTGVRRKLTMSDDRIVETHTESPAWTLPAVVVLGLIAIAGLAFGWRASSKLDGTQQAVATQLKSTQPAVQQNISSLNEPLAQNQKANTDLTAAPTVSTATPTT